MLSPQSSTISAGTTATFTCTIEKKIKGWRFNGKHLQGNYEVEMKELSSPTRYQHTLRIKDTTKSNSGIYTCIVFRGFVKYVASGSLTVEGKYKILATSLVNVTCVMSS